LPSSGRDRSDPIFVGNLIRHFAPRAQRPASVAPAAAVALRPYGVAWHEHNLPSSLRKGERWQLYVRAENRGARSWPARHPGGRSVELAVYFGAALHCTASIPHDVAPGEDVIVSVLLTCPLDAEGGAWAVTVSFLEQNVAWFHEQGVTPLVIEVRSEEPEAGALADAEAIARRSNWSMWLPTDGVTRSRTGRRYPTFIEHAAGCRVRDANGREWIDFVMAGGAALLGYADPEIQAAIARALTSSAVVTLPHMLEAKVTGQLCDLIPGAEMALFGKHGSDMCTAAIRTARLHTRRRTVLYSGYHGWHDWYVQETVQPRLKSPSAASELFRFDLSDAVGFDALVDQHRGGIAAVILEPAAQARSLDDPPSGADAAFLRHVAEVCRDQGAVLIFDEIVTGFRHPQGSVQQATGVVPDLTCLGKALSGGMPLAALVGRREIMQTSPNAAYLPTFRGEVYSLAAAAMSLEIHQGEDVPAQIHGIGTALMEAINEVSRGLGIRGAMIGVPYRQIYRFDEPDARRRGLMRTLLQQELLQRGVLTYKGFMLPSLAHRPADVEQTAAAFREALARVQDVADNNAFVGALEIPLF